MTKNNITKTGFTFVELLVAIALAVLLFMMAYNLMSGTRAHYQHGTVNLQNLQEARMAINYIRRDFSSAAIGIEQGVANITSIQQAKLCMFQVPDWADKDGITLIQLSAENDSSSIKLPRFVFDSNAITPQLEIVAYTHDAQSLTLCRQVISADGKVVSTKNFSGILEVKFSIYTHRLNPNVPFLWVKLLVHEGLSGSKEYGTPLALTASISSPFITSLAKHRDWRFETAYKLR